MKIFKLSPNVDKNLTGSTFTGALIVCAENEKRARQLANREYGIAISAPVPGQEITSLPWSNPQVVNCIGIDGKKCPQDKEGIITKLETFMA